jgi:hypothetical protein
MSKSGFDALMDEVCVGLGFCGCIKRGRPLHVSRFVPSSGPVRADQFAEWVFLADDMNPNSRPERWEKIRAKIEDAFVRHMGGDVVDASQLRWSDDDSDPSIHKFDRGPLYMRVEVWRPLSDGRAMRYNCVQNVHNGAVRVVTADFVSPRDAPDPAQHLYFVEQVVECDPNEPVWSHSIEGAIADHDQLFEN